jgi:hypothetical protein
VAVALRDWLPSVIQAIEPWVSAEDIEKGSRWSTKIAEELQATKAGIICVTADNQNSAWLLFEADALSKTVEKEKERFARISSTSNRLTSPALSNNSRQQNRPKRTAGDW